MIAVFDVLAEPNRRRILEELRGGELTVNDVVGRLDIGQPAVSRHLKVLREAGLVSVRVDQQRRQYRLRPEALAEVDAWIAQFRPFWNERLDALERVLDKENSS
ncbi:MAG: metalloregulator ArsR/SmtB family transcription factor [Chloroflexota bacterium]|nr:metalloregulator ArsR/SmtB family transcription factor [Chloroflexota bacterium]